MLRGSEKLEVECWLRPEKGVTGSDFNGIERRRVIYRWPFGFAPSEALTTKHYRRRFESRHRSFFGCNVTSVAEFESAAEAPPRYDGTSVRNGRADECCRWFTLWLEHEMHLNTSLLVFTPEESEVFCTT